MATLCDITCDRNVIEFVGQDEPSELALRRPVHCKVVATRDRGSRYRHFSAGLVVPDSGDNNDLAAGMLEDGTESREISATDIFELFAKLKRRMGYLSIAKGR
jgi:hypothetical protein